MRLANATLGDECPLPGVRLNKSVEGGGNCLQPMFWREESLAPSADGTTYTAQPKLPDAGHWRGYYIELLFPSAQLPHVQLRVSTPGFVWPDTLPFADCNFAECPPTLV